MSLSHSATGSGLILKTPPTPFEVVWWQFTPWCFCFDATVNDDDNDGGHDNNHRALATYWQTELC